MIISRGIFLPIRTKHFHFQAFIVQSTKLHRDGEQRSQRCLHHKGNWKQSILSDTLKPRLFAYNLWIVTRILLF